MVDSSESSSRRKKLVAVAGGAVLVLGATSLWLRSSLKTGEFSHSPTAPFNPVSPEPLQPVGPLSDTPAQPDRSPVNSGVDNSAEPPAAKQVGTFIDASLDYLANHRLEYELSAEGKPVLVSIEQQFSNKDLKYPVFLFPITSIPPDLQRDTLKIGGTLTSRSPEKISTTVAEDSIGRQSIAGAPGTPSLAGEGILRSSVGPKNGEPYKRLDELNRLTDEQIKILNAQVDSHPEFQEFIKDIATVPVKNAVGNRAADRAIDREGLEALHRLYVLKQQDYAELMACFNKEKTTGFDEENYERAASILTRLTSTPPMEGVTFELITAASLYMQAARLAPPSQKGLKLMMLAYKNQDPLLREHLSENDYEALQRLSPAELKAFVDGVNAFVDDVNHTKTPADIMADMKQAAAVPSQNPRARYTLTKDMFERLARSQLPEKISGREDISLVLDFLTMRRDFEAMQSRNILPHVISSTDGKNHYMALEFPVPPPKATKASLLEPNRQLARASMVAAYLTGRLELPGFEKIRPVKVPGFENNPDDMRKLQAGNALIGSKQTDAMHPVPTQKSLADAFAGPEADGLTILSSDAARDLQALISGTPPAAGIFVSEIMQGPVPYAARVKTAANSATSDRPR